MELRIKTIFGALILCLLTSSSIFAQFPINIGTLEEGDTLVIIYDAKVKEFGSSVTEINNQVKLTGSGISTVLSDDPDITGGANPTLTGAFAPEADLAILGNGQEIVDGSVTTSLFDSTSFGIIGLTETQSVDFYLKNVGFNGLQLDSVKILGLNGSTGFKLNTPVPNFGTAPYDSLKSGDSLLLSIVFEPVAVCPDSAEVVVYTSDVDEAVYSFYITGEATDGIVSNTSDNGCGSLRDVLAKASAGDTIRFSETIAGDTIKLTSGEILLDKDVTIVGNSISRTIIDGQANSRVLQVSSGVNAFLDSLIIQNGNATVQGAGIMNSGNVVMKASIIRNNTTTADGGGIATQGDFKIYNSFLQGNTGNSGGGVQVMNNNLDVYNTQISGNQGTYGGGVSNSGGTIRLYNTTVAGNTATSRGGGISMYGNSSFANNIIASNSSPSNPDIYYDDCGSSLTDLGNNLIGDATNVSSLFSNSTLKGTFAVLLDPLFIENVPTAPSTSGNLRLSFCSPAINAGKDTLGYGIPNFDLANSPRIFAGNIDIGAFETQQSFTILAGQKNDPTECLGTNGSIVFASTYLPDGAYSLSYDGSGSPQTVNVSSGKFTLSGLKAGVYKNFALACYTDVSSITIADPVSPTIAVTSNTNPTTCLGADGTIVFSSSNLSTGSHTLSFNKGTTSTSQTVTVASNGSFSLSNLGAGSYSSFSVTENACEGAFATAQVLTDPASPTIAVTSNTNPTTCLGTDGTIVFSSSNLSAGSHSISFNKGTTSTSQTVTVASNGSFTLSNLGAGSYSSFSVTENACEGAFATAQVLTDPPTPTIAVTSNTNPTTCLGTDGTIVFSSSNLSAGSHSISFNKGTTSTSQTVTVASNGSFSLSNLGEGSYSSFSVTENACEGAFATAQVLTDPPSPTIAVTSNTNPTTCLGTDGTIVFSSSNLSTGSHTLSFNKGTTSTSQTVTVASNGSFSLSNLGAGSYSSFSVTENACEGAFATAQVLTDPPMPTIAVTSNTNPTTCLGTDGTIVFSSSNLSAGSHSISFNKGTTSTSQTVTVASNGSFSLSNLGAGSYSSFSVTENACEGAFATAQVLTDPPTPTIAVTSNTNPTTCLGTDGTIVFSSSNLSAGSHSISFNKGTTSTSQTVTVASNGSFSLSNLGAGSYSSFSVTENACEGAFATAQVLTDPPTPTIAVTSNTNPTTCLGTDGTIVFSSSNLSAGSHSISFNKGTTSTSQTVTVASNGSFTLSNLGAGSYSSFSVTENACEGAFATAQVLTDPPTPTIAVTSNTNPTTCLGTDGTIVFSSSNLSAGSHSISFNKGTTSTSQTVTVASNGSFTLSNLGAGSYSSFSVTENACEGAFATAQVLTDPPTPTIAVTSKTNPTTCLGTDGTIVFSSSNLSAGSHSISFNKGTTSTSQTVTVASNGSFSLSSLGAGSYSSFSVTENACEGAFATAQVLTDPPTPTIAVTSKTNPTTCLGADGTIVFSSSNLSAGSHTLSFNKGTTSTSQTVTVASNGSFSLSNLGAGSYSSFSVTENACEGAFAAAQVLTDPPTPTIAVTSKTNPTTCLGADGTIVFSSSNLSAGSYTIHFSRNAEDASSVINVSGDGSFTLLGLTAAAYSNFSITVNGCEALIIETETLVEPLGSISASNTGPYDEGEMINLNVTGGSNYSWTGPSGYFSSVQNPSITNATLEKAGLYSVTVSDANNCTYTATTEVLVSCSSQKLNYYLVFSDDNPQIISPLVEDLQVQASSRPMSVVAVSSCSQPIIESVKFQLSGTSNLQYYIDSSMPFNLHENMNVNVGDVLQPNHYTFISRGYSQDNAQGNVIVGPDVIPFDVLWHGRTISQPTVNVTEVCAGSNLVVSAVSDNHSQHPYGIGNLYQVYLSEPSGSFKTRTFIGSGGNANAINCLIPQSIEAGDNYKIMVVSTSPVVASEPSIQSVKIIGSDLVLTSPENDLAADIFNKRAINVLKAKNSITGNSHGIYKAGRFIELNAGFEIEGGSVFEAKVQQVCP